MFLLYTLNICHIFFYCFYCWLWTGKYYLGYYNLSILQVDLILCEKRSKKPQLTTLLEKTFARRSFCGISMQIVKGTLSDLRHFLTTKNPLKLMENAFYFTWKALFILKIFKLLSWLYGQVDKWLDWKVRLISKFMTSQSGKQIIVVHILPNTSRRKCNQKIKFGQLIWYKIRKILLQKSFTKYGGETIPRSFSKKSKLSICLEKFYIACFYCMPSWGLPQYIDTKL